MKKLILAVAMLAVASVATAQQPTEEVSARLSGALPPDVVEHVLGVMEQVRARQLPEQAVADRALELAAKGATAPEIREGISVYAQQLNEGRAALQSGGRANPDADEIEAAGEAVSKGVDGKYISELASEAPSGRSLAVPIAVITSLMDRDLPADKAIADVLYLLEQRKSDEELKGVADAARAGRGDGVGREMGEAHRPAGAGRPAGVPANAGSAPRVNPPVQPPTTPRP